MAFHYKGSGNGGSIVKEVSDGVYTIKPKDLDIVWGKDGRYWRVNQEDGSAELIQVCWLEMTGSFPVNRLSPGKYALRFDVKMRADAFGWSGCPVRVMVKPGDQPLSKGEGLVSAAGSSESSTSIPNDGVKFEIKLGTTGKVVFGMFEIWRERWKGGMIINKVTIQKLP